MNSKLEKFLLITKKVKNWPTYFLGRFGFIKNKYLIYEFRNGQKIKARSHSTDWIAINEIFVYNDYTPEGFKINKNDTVVDIGGHIGIFSVFASKFSNKVFCFEPVIENFNLLKENIKLNNIQNIFPFNLAVSDKDGKKELFLYDTNRGGNSFFEEVNGKSQGREVVSTISFENFVSSNNIQLIDFLKMDCEGSEYEILLNCPLNIIGIIKKISMEYHDIDAKRNALVLKEFLEKNGFAVSIVSDKCHYLFAKKI